MPFYKELHIEGCAKVFLWKIAEDFNELFRSVRLKDVSLARLEGMKSESHQKGFLCVRMLLQYCGYSDFDLFYDEFGKPHLKDGTHISISHSFEFSVIALSNDNTGVDLELRRDKIARLAEKFASEPFVYKSKENSVDFISKLTVIWGIKEAVFKIRNEIGISFKDHIIVQPFEMKDKQCVSELHFNGLQKKYSVYFEEIENYTLVCAFERHL